MQAHPVLHVVFLLAFAGGAQAQAVRFDPDAGDLWHYGLSISDEARPLAFEGYDDRVFTSYLRLAPAAESGEAALGLTPTRRRITQDDTWSSFRAHRRNGQRI